VAVPSGSSNVISAAAALYRLHLGVPWSLTTWKLSHAAVLRQRCWQLSPSSGSKLAIKLLPFPSAILPQVELVTGVGQSAVTVETPVSVVVVVVAVCVLVTKVKVDVESVEVITVTLGTTGWRNSEQKAEADVLSFYLDCGKLCSEE